MKVASITAVALAAALGAACTRTTQHSPSTQAETRDRACRAVIAAPAGDDRDIARLQQDLRQRAPAPRAAEQLGYRFVSRARVSNNSLDYAVAEQAAACL